MATTVVETHAARSRRSANSPRSESPVRNAKQMSSARRDKKRVADRQCQRQARARTKNRIAELEGLVAELTSRSGNEACNGLLDQLDRSRAENLALRRKLSAISTIAHTPGESNDTSDSQTRELESDSPPSGLRAISDWSQKDQPNLLSWSDTSSTFPEIAMDHQMLCLEGNPNALPEQTYFSNMSNGPSVVLSADLQSDGVTTKSLDFGYPESWAVCDCAGGHDAGGQPENMWKFASETLLKWQSVGMKHRDRINQRSDADIAVRAVIEGWPAVGVCKAGPSWQILHLIDQKIWQWSRPVDRLAVLCIMNLLLQCHLNPTPENLGRLPAWYRPRPSQIVNKHLYAIDFFVWPGIRERFIYQQHKYCSDNFWKMMAEHFRFIWPYDFRDCYVRNTITGTYQLSELFLSQLNDICCFSFCKDMFGSFPEFTCDIPKFDFIPVVPTDYGLGLLPKPRVAAKAGRRFLKGGKAKQQPPPVGVPIEEEEKQEEEEEEAAVEQRRRQRHQEQVQQQMRSHLQDQMHMREQTQMQEQMQLHQQEQMHHRQQMQVHQPQNHLGSVRAAEPTGYDIASTPLMWAAHMQTIETIV